MRLSCCLSSRRLIDMTWKRFINVCQIRILRTLSEDCFLLCNIMEHHIMYLLIIIKFSSLCLSQTMFWYTKKTRHKLTQFLFSKTPTARGHWSKENDNWVSYYFLENILYIKCMPTPMQRLTDSPNRLRTQAK